MAASQRLAFARQHVRALAVSGTVLLGAAVLIAFASLVAYFWAGYGALILGVSLGGLLQRLLRPQEPTQLLWNAEVSPVRERLIAGAVDAGMIWLMWVVSILIVDDFLAWFVMVASVPLYFGISTATLGASPGSSLVGCTVVDVTGRPMHPVRAAARALFMLASVGALAIGFAWIFFDPNRQALHDHVFGTIVVGRHKKMRLA